jgi:hypothetical protein
VHHLSRCKTPPPLSLHSASSRLRTGESLHLACFWPSPTSMARREHHLCASGVRGWVRTVRSVSGRGASFISMQNTTPIIATFGIIPSPHRQITAPSLLLAFAHIHGEAGTPSLRIRSAVVVGPNGAVLGVVEGVHHLSRCKTPPPLSLHSASSRLRTGESLHLACFWPSPTSMARREHHLCASGVRWSWVRTVRFCEWKGCIIYLDAKHHPHYRYIRHHPVSAQANHCA